MAAVVSTDKKAGTPASEEGGTGVHNLGGSVTERTITITHDGVTYTGHVATIKGTSLGYEDHGILTAFLHCEWSGSGIGVGGYCLDRHKDGPGFGSRQGTAYGLDHVMRLMETVGVNEWEQIKGRQVIVLFEGTGSTLGMTAAGIAHITDEKRVLILKDHAAEWQGRESFEVSS